METYDVIIVGAGPAGIACSIELAKNNFSSLLIEKRCNLNNKVCGDGLTVKAITLLAKIGIDVNELIGKKVHFKKTYNNENVKAESFAELFGFDYEYGISRDILDSNLLNYSLELGTHIKWNEECVGIRKNEFSEYIVNEKYLAKNVVLACGAIGGRKLGINIPSDLPVGMSSRIKGVCDYDDDSFHFFYNEKYGSGYAWIFPVGESVWNVGVWSSNKKNIKELYEKFEKEIFTQTYTYDRFPKGAVIGASKQKKIEKTLYHLIGDCACSSDYYSGEGVSYALEDGICMANKILGMVKNGLL